MEEYFSNIISLLKEVDDKEKDNINKAAEMFSETIKNGGLIHVFGSGHSHALSLEISYRAGGLVPIKAMDEPGRGLYQKVEGVGTRFMEYYDLRSEDLILITSNSSRNPISIEIALYAKERNIPVITCYSKKYAEKVTSNHSSGKKVYEIADLAIDNHCDYGDASIKIDGLDVKIGPTTTVITSAIYNRIVVSCIKQLVNEGIIPPILVSNNFDNGEEFNEKVIEQYKDRLFYKRHLKN